MMTQGQGFLTIWSDIAPEHETDYLHWLTREHTSERVGCEGFLAVRVFRALPAEPRRYLICYELEHVDAVDGPDYVAHLNAPTPWTRQTLPRLQNFVRGGGTIVYRAGLGEGGFVTALPLAQHLPENGAPLIAALVRHDRIVAARYCVTDPARTAVKTLEKNLRGADQAGNERSFVGVLQIEALDENALTSTREALKQFSDSANADPMIYRQIFRLSRSHLESQVESQASS